MASLTPALFTPNAWIDCAFYNIDCLEREEVNHLVRIGKVHNEPPGTVIRVTPDRMAGDGRARIRIASADNWHSLADQAVRTAVVAGVGSSVLGTAALAMDVAGRLGEPVIGVVTGSGTRGAAIDGLIGWYWYEPINRLDDYFVSVSHDVTDIAQFDAAVVELGEDFSGPSNAEATLAKLVLSPAIVRVIAHSKGSLQLEPLLWSSEAELARREGGTLKVGTLGAVIALPDSVAGCQVLGDCDWLGRMVSSSAPRHTLPLRAHSLNPNWPLGFGISLKDDVWGKFGADSAFA